MAENQNRMTREEFENESDFIQDPELLTDDQVKELLRIAFRQKDVRKALEKMLKDAENDV